MAGRHLRKPDMSPQIIAEKPSTPELYCLGEAARRSLAAGVGPTGTESMKMSATALGSEDMGTRAEAGKPRFDHLRGGLGADRPVVRWISRLGMATAPAAQTIACVRPNYPPNIALPSAKQEEEEEDLQQRYPAMTVVRTTAEFNQLLNRTDVGIVHFAGHARGNPPNLILEDDAVSALKFSSSSPLMNTAPPRSFLRMDVALPSMLSSQCPFWSVSRLTG